MNVLMDERRITQPLPDLAAWTASFRDAEIPVLETFDSVGLPGSQAFYSYRNRNRNAEFIENLMYTVFVGESNQLN